MIHLLHVSLYLPFLYYLVFLYLKRLFQDQFGSVCQGIYRLVNDQELTRDLAQNVFIRLWEKRKDLNIQSSLPAYLRRMGHNEALAHIRANKKWQMEEVV